MARNGSGTYNLPSGNPVTTGTTITSTWANATMSDVGYEITNSLARDGQSPMTANLPMAGYSLSQIAGIQNTSLSFSINTDLSFTGMTRRITADFSSATIAGRAALQTSVANGSTLVGSLPNGTATLAGFIAYNNSDPTNSAWNSMYADATEVYISSGISGTGTLRPMVFSVGAEAMRIDINRNLQIGGTTGIGKLQITGGSANACSMSTNGSIEVLNIYNTSNGSFTGIRFINNNFVTLVGSITCTTTATAYNTSSDYRLKNVEGPLTDSGVFIDALRPVYGTWKADGSKFVGFIAHELQAVSPTSVTGEKDAIDENQAPIYQAMEYGSPETIANIVAELQSLRLRVARLESA